MPQYTYTDVSIPTGVARKIFGKILPSREKPPIGEGEDQVIATHDVGMSFESIPSVSVVRFPDKGVTRRSLVGYFAKGKFIAIGSSDTSLMELELGLIYLAGSSGHPKEMIWHKTETCHTCREHESCGCKKISTYSRETSQPDKKVDICYHCSERHPRIFKSRSLEECDAHVMKRLS